MLGDYDGPKLLRDPLRDPEELALLAKRNNPEGYPVGPEFGRCHLCHSWKLWVDYSTYYCNDCGNSYPLPCWTGALGALVSLSLGPETTLEFVEAM